MKKYKWLLIPLIGNIFEWYEFAIFSSLAGTIGKIFFDNQDHFQATMIGFLIYSIGFISRPFGTFIFGYIGDKYGRKHALSYSLLLMFVATIFIPFIPSYAEIGIYSSVMLIIVRVLQGVSFGGEFSSVVTYTCEMAPVGKKGLFASLQVSCVIFAIICGLLTVLSLHYFYTDLEIISFAWKIPFFFAIIIGLFGLYIRSKATETNEFIEMKKSNIIVQNPFLYFFKNYYKEFFICSTWILSTNIMLQIFTIGSKAIFENVFKFDNILSTSCGITVCVITIPFMLFGGFIVEKIELQKFRKIYTIFLIIISNISGYFVVQDSKIFIFLGMSLMSIAIGIGNGSYPYYYYKYLPVQIRDTLVGFSIAIPSILTTFSGAIFMKLFYHYGINSIYIILLAGNIFSIIGLILDLKLFKLKK